MFDAAVIGGGASALFACAMLKGVRTVVFEAAPRAGRKLLATGNGKCNLSNASLDAGAYNAPAAAARFLKVYGSKNAVADFSSMGLLTKETDGRIYPYSECASTVLDTLRFAAQRAGARIFCGRKVVRTEPVAEGFRVTAERAEDGVAEEYAARCVVLATGSDASFGLDSTGLYTALGHTARPFSPSLTPVRTDKDDVKGLAGVRVKGALTIGGTRECGEILFKESGISGIASFNVSALFARGAAKTGDCIELDFMPDIPQDKAAALFEKYAADTAAETLRGVFHSRIAERIIRRAGLMPDDAPDAFALAAAAKRYRITARGNAGASLAQVMSGGLSLDCFDEGLQSRLCKGAFATGEALDMDGICGGYNLQWAWTSAYIAAGSVRAYLSKIR